MFDRLARSLQEIPVTWGLSILHGVLYMYVASVDPTFSSETLMKMGALSNPSVWDGELYRLIVSGFLHGGAAHFMMNNFALIMLGRLLERLFGSVGFFSLYFMALLAGSISSLVFMPPMAVSVGASGAIMGLAGALFVLLLLDRNERFLETQSFGKNLFLGLIMFQLLVGGLIPFINNSAHVGGFAVGICFGLFFWSRIPGEKFPRPLGSVIMGVCILGFCALAVRGLTPKGTYAWHLHAGLKAFQDTNTKLAFQNAKISESSLLSAIQIKPSDLNAQLSLGELYTQRKEYKKAAPIYAKLTEKEPKRFLFWLRWIGALAKSGQRSAANKAFLKAKDKFIRDKVGSGWMSFFSPIAHTDRDLLLARLCIASLQERRGILLYLELLEREPYNPIYHNDFAWVLVTSHNRTLRNAKLAIDHATFAVAQSPNAAYTDTLATAYFENGQYKKAIQMEKKAIFQRGAKWSMPHFHFQILRFEKKLKSISKTKKPTVRENKKNKKSKKSKKSKKEPTSKPSARKS